MTTITDSNGVKIKISEDTATYFQKLIMAGYETCGYKTKEEKDASLPCHIIVLADNANAITY